MSIGTGWPESKWQKPKGTRGRPRKGIGKDKLEVEFGSKVLASLKHKAQGDKGYLILLIKLERRKRMAK